MYNAAMWLAKVKESYGDDLQIEWRPFFLAQVNSTEGPEWKAWEQREDSPKVGILAMRAGQAASRQGSQAFESFQLALLQARHEERVDLSDPKVIMDTAKASGLDMARFQEDLDDEGIRQEMGESHTHAVEELGVFGTPTFVFPNGAAAYLKTYQPPGEDSVEVFDSLVNVMGKWEYIGEVKRPQPPWPKGVLS